MIIRSVGLFQVVERTRICSYICKNVQGRQEKHMPSQKPGFKGSEDLLKLSYRIQGKPKTWDTFWLPYRRPSMLPTLMIFHDGDPILLMLLLVFLLQATPFYSFYVNPIFCLRDSYILSLLPTPHLFMPYNQTYK